ncbi:F-box protein, partial [Cucurbita argyrosperma subsp. argyrosperma]
MLRRKPPKIITRSTTAAAKSLVDNDDLLLHTILYDHQITKSFAFELWIPQTTKSRFTRLILGSGGPAARVHSPDRFIKEIDRGVYWNGAVHWVRYCGKGIYFDLSEEKLHEFPVPEASNDRGHKIVKYFGGCCGHLYWVEGVELEPMELIVYEMEDDHCGWFVKYRVDLKWVWSWYQNPGSGGMEALYSKFTVLAIVDQSIVNAKSGSFEMDGFINIGRTSNTPHGFRTIEALLYIESLACV